MIFLFIFVAINCIFFLLLYYNLWAEKGRIYNYFRQLNCHVLDIKVIAMRSKRRDYNSYKVTYVDYAFNLFRINCTAANFGFGLNWSDRRFIRRLSDREIVDLRIQFAQKPDNLFHDLRISVTEKIHRFREKWKLQNLSGTLSDELVFQDLALSKEVLIDGLHSPLSDIRKSTIIQIQSLERVDAVILQELQRLVAMEPEPTIREVAQELISELSGS